MKPEIKACLDLFIEADNDCKDALIAGWSEKDPVRKQVLREIYKEKDNQRSKLIKKLNELTKLWRE